MFEKKEITNQILLFRNFLCDSYESVKSLMNNHNWHDDTEFIDEWLYANWELLIERELFYKTVRLCSPCVPYKYSRVINPEIEADYAVIAYPFENDVCVYDAINKTKVPLENGLRLVGFVTIVENIGFGFYPPFDTISVYDDKTKKLYAIKIVEASYFVVSLKKYLI